MDLELKCQHNLPPRLWTSRKQPGRQFYRCPKPIAEQCEFFLWLDEIPSPSQNRVLPPTPQSAQPSGATLYEPPSTPTPLSRKRNVPDDISNSATLSWQSQKRARLGNDDEEEHLGQPMSQSPERLVATKPSTSDDRLNASAHVPDEGASMSQVTVCSDLSEEMSADSVGRKLQVLSEVPEYIRKLERRKIAAEMSRDAKAQKIADLMAEVERLKRREAQLEELIAILESAQA